MNTIYAALVTAHARVIHIYSVDNPVADFTGPGVSALQRIANVTFAIVLICGLIGGLISGGAITIGHLSSNGTVQKRGIIGVFACIAGVAVAGSVAGLINWGQSLHVA